MPVDPQRSEGINTRQRLLSEACGPGFELEARLLPWLASEFAETSQVGLFVKKERALLAYLAVTARPHSRN